MTSVVLNSADTTHARITLPHTSPPPELFLGRTRNKKDTKRNNQHAPAIPPHTSLGHWPLMESQYLLLLTGNGLTTATSPRSLRPSPARPPRSLCQPDPRLQSPAISPRANEDESTYLHCPTHRDDPHNLTNSEAPSRARSRRLPPAAGTRADASLALHALLPLNSCVLLCGPPLACAPPPGLCR